MSFVRLLVCLCSCLEFGHGILSASKCGYIVGLIAKFQNEKGTIFSPSSYIPPFWESEGAQFFQQSTEVPV